MNRDWILVLGKGDIDSPRVPLSNKEQFNGLEAIGDVSEDAEEDAPMDEKVDSKEEGKPASEEKPKEQEAKSETPEDTEASKTVSNDEDNADNQNNDDSADGSQTDGTEDENDGEKIGDISKDPHFIQNRRILLSNKLLRLYNSIKDSINLIANGPSFDKKPVMLENLETLSETVSSINDSINKESDHKVLLLRYAVCVKTFNKLIAM